MFNSQNDRIAVLGVCVGEPPRAGPDRGLEFWGARSGRRALDLMRVLRFDLLLVGTRLPDLSTWDFVRRVRVGWAWQKWALIAGDGVGSVVSESQERSARMFGTVRVFDGVPNSDEVLRLASALRERAARSVFQGTYDRGTALLPAAPAGPQLISHQPSPAGF